MSGQVNGGVFSPQNLELYTYTANNPVNMVDPDGKFYWFAVGAVVAVHDAYGNYKEGGWEAVGEGLATDALITVATGGVGKVATKVGTKAYDAYKSTKTVKITVNNVDDIKKLDIEEGIYEFKEKGAMYVGQSAEGAERLTTHLKKGKLKSGTEVTFKKMPGSTKTEREIAEHKRIQEITGGVPARKSSNVTNKVDPIGKGRKHLLDEK